MALKTNTYGYFPSKRFVEPLPPPPYIKNVQKMFFFPILDNKINGIFLVYDFWPQPFVSKMYKIIVFSFLDNNINLTQKKILYLTVPAAWCWVSDLTHKIFYNVLAAVQGTVAAVQGTVAAVQGTVAASQGPNVGLT